jgi:septum formation inhibitor MinC
MENDDIESGMQERGGLVTARGTSDGLVIRLDGRVDHESLKDALMDFMISRKAFLSGNEVLLEWVGQRPDSEFVDEISQNLQKDFNVNVKSSRMREYQRVNPVDVEGTGLAGSIAQINTSASSNQATAFSGPGYSAEIRSIDGRLLDSSRKSESASRSDYSSGGKTMSLFDGIEALRRGVEPALSETVEEKSRFGGSLWDDPDARVLYTTLRSGQKFETEHSLVVFGDVNSGAEIIAGGDIVVLGTLRGVAHAGAYDETGGGRVIFALRLNPTQLRIGMVISQGTSETQNVPEVARVEGNMIVVEPYQARNAMSRRRD